MRPRVRVLRCIDRAGRNLLVLSTRNSAMFANAVVFGAGGAAGVGPHSGLAPVVAGAEPPITERVPAAQLRRAKRGFARNRTLFMANGTRGTDRAGSMSTSPLHPLMGLRSPEAR